jgi:hypothetical protein
MRKPWSRNAVREGSKKKSRPGAAFREPVAIVGGLAFLPRFRARSQLIFNDMWGIILWGPVRSDFMWSPRGRWLVVEMCR